jgi:acetyl esterase/lipase
MHAGQDTASRGRRRGILPGPLAAAAFLGLTSCAHAPAPAPARVTWAQVAALPVPPADHREPYGSDSLQFGELRLPRGRGPFPVAIVIHGGCWRSEYDLQHVGPLAGALTRRGIATWTIEYRRIGDPGGGWPGTFEDVAHAADHLRALARTYPLDLTRVVAVGHSAGGHLALWLASRAKLPRPDAFAADEPLPLRGVVGLAAISDLGAYARGSSWCCQSALLLMGGSPDSLPERYALGDPIQRLPFGIPVRLVHGSEDAIVPIAQSRAFVEAARAKHDDATLTTVAGAGHFDLVAPDSPAGAIVLRTVSELLRR